MMAATAGIDVGGTNTKVGLVSADMHVLGVRSFPTERTDPSAFLDGVRRSIELLRTSVGCDEVEAAGIGVPGFVDADGERVITTLGFVEFMENLDLARALSALLDVPVAVDNDARIHALGEYYCDPQPPRSLVVVTLGTGVGVGWICEGKLLPPPDSGAMGGHTGLDRAGGTCYCGGRGCAELSLSATGLLARALEEVARRPGSCLADRGEELTTEHIIAEADRDTLAADLMAGYIGDAKVFLQSLFHCFFPDLIILGGGLARGLGRWQSDLQGACDRLSRYDGRRTVVRVSTLGVKAGVLGAAALIANRKLKKVVL